MESSTFFTLSSSGSIMKIPVSIIIFVINTVLFTLVSSQRQYYCGRKLPTALTYFCDNKMNRKRDEFEVISLQRPQYSWPWMEPYAAMNFGRGKRQIAVECCENPCSIQELMAYCPN